MPMANEIGSITLGGENVVIQSLTLDQLQRVIPVLREHYAAVNQRADLLSPQAISRCGAIISTALNRPETEITAALDELFPAVNAIAEVSGLLRLGEQMKAALEMMQDQSTGTASTPNS